jgi:glycosyltransferase involved in cell wall biosynthesis
MSNINITILIPFLNEAVNVPFIISELNLFCKTNNNLQFEIIFIDDGSTDESVKLLSEGKKQFKSKIIKFSKNFGAHAALRAGILKSEGNYITFMYADLQDPLELINRMYEKCEGEGKDICWASRNNFTTGFFERTFSRIYAALIKKYVSKDFPENGFDVVMFNSKIKESLNSNIENNSSVFLQIMTLGFKSDSVAYKKVDRRAGQSKWTFSKRMKLMIDSFVSFSYAPIRFVTAIGISLFVIGLMLSVYLIFRKILYNDLAAGWAMLISIIMLGFGITNISLGIIAEYLWRTLDSSRKRPVFIIDQIIDLKNDN